MKANASLEERIRAFLELSTIYLFGSTDPMATLLKDIDRIPAGRDPSLPVDAAPMDRVYL